VDLQPEQALNRQVGKTGWQMKMNSNDALWPISQPATANVECVQVVEVCFHMCQGESRRTGSGKPKIGKNGKGYMVEGKKPEGTLWKLPFMDFNQNSHDCVIA